jgi:hypothetical protein
MNFTVRCGKLCADALAAPRIVATIAAARTIRMRCMALPSRLNVEGQ